MITSCSYSLTEILPQCQQEVLFTFFIVKYYRWKKEVQHFREKWLAANIDCHCLEKQEGAK